MNNPLNFRLTRRRVRAMQIAALVAGWLVLIPSLPFRLIHLIVRCVERVFSWIVRGFESVIADFTEIAIMCRIWREGNKK